MPTDPPRCKPLVFISYSHKDETPWLELIRTYLGPAVAADEFTVWHDRDLRGGDDWDGEIQDQLANCDICVLLVSVHSTQSAYILNKEIRTIQDRQAAGEEVVLYPILLTPTPDAGLAHVAAKNWRPKDGRSLSSFGAKHDRLAQLTDIANELSRMLAAWTPTTPKPPRGPKTSSTPDPLDIDRLPDTPNRKLVGRAAELALLDAAWASPGTHIVSLIAEGGVGKSALVNEWLTRLQDNGYGGAEAVLGWSFYSQGSKDRMTSAEPFLNWAVAELGLRPAGNDATAKAKAIAQAMADRRVLLVLDGVEPLQDPPGPTYGRLRDTGLRTLLRRVAAQPAGGSGSLIVLTSRAPVADIEKWHGAGNDGTAPSHRLDTLSPEAGAELLRDVIMLDAPVGARPPTQKELEAASREFGGHALSLGLLGGYTRDVHDRDLRRRTNIRALRDYADNPGHDHAERVLESYVDEWLKDQPRLLAILHIIGLFDRPADAGCLAALRREPAIPDLTDALVGLGEPEWKGAIAQLRRARLLLDEDPNCPGELDAHPLVREFFGGQLEREAPDAWRAAHSRLYDHLTATDEGDDPDLEALAPLFQAMPHGVRAGRAQEALRRVYMNRLCRRGADGELVGYASKKLGASGQVLSTVTWLFDEPYGRPIADLVPVDRTWVISEAAFALQAIGRLEDAIVPMAVSLEQARVAENWRNAAIAAGNLSVSQLAVGRIADAVVSARQAIEFADKTDHPFQKLGARTQLGAACHQIGDSEAALEQFIDAEARQANWQPGLPRLYSMQCYWYCDLLLDQDKGTNAFERANYAMPLGARHGYLLDIALATVTIARASLHLTLRGSQEHAVRAREEAANSVDRLRSAGIMDEVPLGLLVRAEVSRAIGDWQTAIEDLDEVLEIAEPGPMKLFMADAALERCRLCLARIDADAPLNHHFDDIPEPAKPGPEEAAKLLAEAKEQAQIARKLIDECGYGRRSQAIADLEAELARRGG
ncbi:MAG: TIR domain-containing protein [Rhodospirillaceae bacterium]|nr:TIR domain-containing protein [Rhodospirillaceae bacterium]